MTRRCGDAPAGGEEPGPARPAPEFWNLAAVRRADALVEALAARAVPADDAPPGPAAEAGDEAETADGPFPDPVARLLWALVTDVDAGAPEPPALVPEVWTSPPVRPGRHARPPQAVRPAAPEPSAAPEPNVPETGGTGQPGPRRGPRTIVLLGVVGPLLSGVLATTGVAAAHSGPAEPVESGPGAGERAGPERELRAGARPGEGAARAAMPAAVIGTGRTRTRPVVAVAWPVRAAGDAEDRTRRSRDLREDDRRTRPGPHRAEPPADEPGTAEPRLRRHHDGRPEPGRRGILPFVQPDLRLPGGPRDRRTAPPGTADEATPPAGPGRETL